MSMIGSLKSVKRIISLGDANHALLSQTHAAISRMDSLFERMEQALKSHEVILNANQAILTECQNLLKESAQKEEAVLTTCLESLQTLREQSHAHKADFDALNASISDLQKGMSQLVAKAEV